MEQYENLKIEVIEFGAEDVIVTSPAGASDPVGGGGTGGNG